MILLAAALACIAGHVSAATPFEDVHVVKMPKGTHGYRGMNGDFLQLKDGSLLYCFTQGGIAAVTVAGSRKNVERTVHVGGRS